MRNDFRLFLPALVVWGFTALLLHQPHQVVQVAAVAAVSMFALVGMIIITWRWTRLGHSRVVPVSLVMLLLTSAMLSAVLIRVGVEHQLRHPALLTQARLEAASVSFEAALTSVPQEESKSFAETPQYWATAVISRIAVGTTHLRVSIPVRLSGAERNLAQSGIGSTIRGSGVFTLMEHSRDTVYRVAAQEIRATSPPEVLAWAETLRSSLREEAASLSGWGAELIPGLAVGDTRLVSEQLDEAMKSASLTHLTAVSGANCAIITGLILLLGKKLRLRVWIRVGIALLFLALFVVLVTPEPSVLRAAVMSLLALISLLSARKALGTAALAVAMLTLLILDPWQAVHFGFILSVLATAGIILFTKPIAEVMGRWLPASLALVIAVPLAAQLACQPAILLLQPTLPVLGVFANVLAAPAAPVATVMGLVACVLLPLWPLAGTVATCLTWLPASWIALIASSIEGLPFAQLPWIGGWPGVALLVIIITITLISLLLPNVLPPGRTLTQLERARLPLISIALSTLSAISIVHPWATQSALPAHWRIYVCDVGQGDAALIRGSGGTMLIDTGIDPERVSTCLDDASVSRIDVLVLTHDDADHVGGASGVLAKTQRALISPSSESKTERKLVQLLERGGVQAEIAQAGMSGSLGDVAWSVLWPGQQQSTESRNDSSVVIRVDTPEFSGIFLGDLGADAQRSLLASQRVAAADVVKVSHHGSSDQHGALYTHISASFGIVSVGQENNYGHPTATALSQLRAAGTNPLRTDTLGAFAFARNRHGEWVIWRSAALG